MEFFSRIEYNDCTICYKKEVLNMKYECEPCGYVYDPEAGDPDNGIDPGTSFEDLPEDGTCPLCGGGKDMFVPAT